MEHHVIGIGQGGCRIASQIAVHTKSLVVINSNEVDLADIDPSVPRFILRDEKGQAIGVGADPDFGLQLFKSHKEDLGVFLNAAMTGVDMEDACLWICAALGGGTGSAGVIPVTNLIHSQKPSVVNVVVALPSESDGINKVRNAFDVLFDIYTKLCVDHRKANLFILDNAAYPNIKHANHTLVKSIYYLLKQFPEVEPFPGSAGHADERDLMTVLKQKSGCLTLSEGEVDNVFCGLNRFYFNQYFQSFLGLDYEIMPTGVWLRDHTEGKNRSFIQEFMHDHRSTVMFYGEYKELHTQSEFSSTTKRINGTTIMLMTGLPLPPTLVEKRRQLMTNYKDYKDRTSGSGKIRTAKRISVSRVKL